MRENKKRKAVVAIDSFKGCMTSAEANASAAAAFAAAGLSSTTFTVSDGGEGMLDAFSAAWGARRVTVATHDALMRRRDGAIAIAGDTAIIEVAEAAGLTLVEPERRNAFSATSYGVGELVAEAVRRHCHHLIIGLGGTATSDCGIGMLRALIDNLTDGGTVDDLHLDDIDVALATDVDNPLLGADGAASVFAPQKGASPEMVFMIEHRAATFARLSARHCGHDAASRRGAGAAGGLGYAFLQFFNSRIESGADMLLRKLRFDDAVADADIIVTGEGSADAQTLMGKLPSRVLTHATASGHRPEVWLVAGRVEDELDLAAAGFTRVININGFLHDGENPLDKAVAERNLRESISAALQ